MLSFEGDNEIWEIRETEILIQEGAELSETLHQLSEATAWVQEEVRCIFRWACRPRSFAINTLVLKISVLSFHIQKLVKPAL